MQTIEAQVIDNTHLRLFEPIQLPGLTTVTIFVAPPESDERAAWSHAAAYFLSRAYGHDEPEYPTELVKDPNPEFVP